MPGDILKSILEFLKLAPRYLIALAVSCAILVFANENILSQIGLLEFTQNYRQWLGVIMLVTASLFFVDLFIRISRCIRKWLSGKKIQKGIVKDLGDLTEKEKQILRYYIHNRTKTNYLRTDDGVVRGLEFKRIIFKASLTGHILNGFAYNISEIAWKQLNQNLDLLDGETNISLTHKNRIL